MKPISNKQVNSASKIIRGCWQLASDHSKQNTTIDPINDALEHNFTTFDCGDIYLGVEELLGKALIANPHIKMRIHTKFVPDIDALNDIDHAYVENIIDRSLKRLKVSSIDLVQFHWWDFEVKNYLHAMEILAKVQAKGKIKEIGLTNVNRFYLEEISGRFDIASLQVQASIFDKRINRGIADLCHKKNIKIFAYGTLLGGFLSEAWMNQDEPELKNLKNRSLVKYKLLIDSCCGWKEYQRRLFFLNELAIKYQRDIASISLSLLFQENQIDGAIVGLSPDNYALQNQRLKNLPLLNEEEIKEVKEWKCNLTGDAYDEERNKNGAHAKVMKYNLNAK